MNKINLLLLCLAFEIMVIAFIAFANMLAVGYFIFYNLLYGIVVSIILPLLFLAKEGNGLAAAGFKKPGRRQFIVLFFFIAFSIGAQLIPKLIAGEPLLWDVLPIAILPLIMTTFFEEFLFHGFLQTRLEKRYGFVAAIIVSGLMFSLYHLGYPRFRTVDDILVLFAVGVGFAFAFFYQATT